MVSVSLNRYQQIWEAHRPEFSVLVRIPSVYEGATATDAAPCGAPVARALDYIKTLCAREGFVIREYDGRAFSASWGGRECKCGRECEGEHGREHEHEPEQKRGRERIDIVSHLDVVGVVPDDWAEDPFSGSVHDGCVHGRGTQDMKAGAYLTFLALKLVKDSGIVPKREICLVYGTDEERTMDDMRWYVGKAGLPAFAFTPDGAFPMVNGEKGALMWTVEGAYTGAVRALTAGIQPNVIPPEAAAVLDSAAGVSAETAKREAERLGITARVGQTPEGLFIHVQGKAAHASKPEAGRNALSDLLRLLAALCGEEALCRLAAVFGDAYGRGTGLEHDLSPMGRLTLNPGIASIENGKLRFLVDCRYPYGVDSAALTETLRQSLPDYDVALPYDDPPTFTPENDPYILALKAAYTEATGRECPAAISGGVSYSKVFGHCVTFGAVAEGSELLAHQENERIREADCISALEIYHRAILKLMEV
ncbi:MAG: M20 family metallopeptidase [Subdoligranulum sp.]|nr:M20 family metallopeptidase [Subdoligranulum sp.]